MMVLSVKQVKMLNHKLIGAWHYYSAVIIKERDMVLPSLMEAYYVSVQRDHKVHIIAR